MYQDAYLTGMVHGGLIVGLICEAIAKNGARRTVKTE